MTKRLAIALLTLCFGVVGVMIALYFSRGAREGRDWPTVPGKILARGVGEQIGRHSFVPRVEYTYVVAGTQYQNDRVYQMKTGDMADKVQRLVDGLPDPIPVHYDPQDPARSYLLHNPTTIYWIIVAFSAFTLLVGTIRLVTALRDRP